MTNKLEDVISAINAATNDLATRIDRLIGSSTVSQAQLTELTAIRDRLNGLAADPANPVPSTDPAVPPAPETAPAPTTDEPA